MLQRRRSRRNDGAGRTITPYPPPKEVASTGASAARARQLLTVGDSQLRLPACVACHGTSLTGVAPHVPGLLGLPADYLIAQLGAWRTGYRHARNPDCMADVARKLPLEDIARVARWLAAQPVPADASPAARPPGEWPMDCGGKRP